MTRILLPLLLVSSMSSALPGADARESAIESKCLSRIRQHYKEPAEARSDRDYKTMKLKALLFVGNDAAVKSSEFAELSSCRAFFFATLLPASRYQ